MEKKLTVCEDSKPTKKMIEHKLISWKEFKSEQEEIAEWFDRLGRGGSCMPTTTVVSKNTEEEGRYTLKFYTERYKYLINVCSPASSDPAGAKGYIGATMSSRKNKTGLNYPGCGDLSDGPCNKHTVDSIFRDIVANEMVELHPRAQEMVCPK